LIDLASVGAFATLLIVSLGLSSVLQYAGGAFDNEIPFGYVVVRILGVLFSVVLLVFLLGAIYRYLPARRLSWAAISAGALVAAALFGVGRFIMVAWLASVKFESVYGSIAFMVVFLLWVYFSAQVVLYGAAFAAVTERHCEDADGT
jgi:membrane protein